jgi:hypothetical protein
MLPIAGSIWIKQYMKKLEPKYSSLNVFLKN